MTGPTLTLVATCAGCDQHRTGLGYLATVAINSNACEHPEGRRDRIPVGATTPSWCPLLPAARMAFARAVVKEGEQ